jgi:hypothetical protein
MEQDVVLVVAPVAHAKTNPPGNKVQPDVVLSVQGLVSLIAVVLPYVSTVIEAGTLNVPALIPLVAKSQLVCAGLLESVQLNLELKLSVGL